MLTKALTVANPLVCSVPPYTLLLPISAFTVTVPAACMNPLLYTLPAKAVPVMLRLAPCMLALAIRLLTCACPVVFSVLVVVLLLLTMLFS